MKSKTKQQSKPTKASKSKFYSTIASFLRNPIARHTILIVCSIIVLIFLVVLSLNLITRHNKQFEVPDFVGIDLKEATRLADKGELEIYINDSLYNSHLKGGVILDQNPKAGSKVKKGRRIFVVINSYNQRQIELPYITGYSLRQAKNILEKNGLNIDEIIYKEDMGTNSVIEQRVNGKVINADSHQMVYVGSSVTLVVGLNASDNPTVTVPKIIGLTLAEAKSRLWERGLNVGSLRYDDDIDITAQDKAKVYIQSPGQAEIARLGTKVTLRLTLNQDLVNENSTASDKAAQKLIKERMVVADSIATSNN